MHIVLAPDSFKGSLSTIEAATAMEEGVLRALPEARISKIPIADGGEGTVDAVLAARGGHLRSLDVVGPQGDVVRASYGFLDDGITAVLEMAAASGLMLTNSERRDPGRATTFGTGQLIADAVSNGARRIVIGVGGSATNDCGVGMARALGYRFLDAEGEALDDVAGGTLGQVASIDGGNRPEALSDVEILVACDVMNPLLGPSGCSFVYGPQKGASEDQIELLEDNMKRFAELVERCLGIDLAALEGAGAAGGLAAGLVAFAGARIERGIELLIRLTRLDRVLEDADLVVTGEGRVDSQTAFGKTPLGIARQANRKGVPVVVIGGSVGRGAHMLFGEGIAGLESAVTDFVTLDEAIKHAPRLVADATERSIRSVLIGLSMPGNALDAKEARKASG